MPGIDLSTLSVPELRRLLDLARARGQGVLERDLLAELGARGARPPVAALEVGPIQQHPVPPPTPDRPDRPQARRLWLAGLAAAGISLAAVAMVLNLDGTRAPAPTPAALPRPHSPAPAPSRAMVARARPVAPPVATATPLTEPLHPATTPHESVAPEIRPRIPAPRQAACPDARNTADRLVCADRNLAARRRELNEAYIRALNTRADPSVVDEDQAAWRRARDAATDSKTLEQLYENRIRALNAASAAAVAAHAGAGQPPAQ